MNYEYQNQGQLSSQQVLMPINITIKPDYKESNANDSDLDNDTTEILKVNDVFKDWDTVKIAINIYTKHNSIIAIKTCKDIDAINKSIIQRHIYHCWKSEINNLKKTEDITLYRNSVLTKTNCPWQVSFYFGKRVADIHLIKFDNNHNHQCNPTNSDVHFLCPKHLLFQLYVL